MLPRHWGHTVKTEAIGCVLTRPPTSAANLRLETSLAAIANTNLDLYAQLEALSKAEATLSKGVTSMSLLPETARLYSEVVRGVNYHPEKVRKALLKLPKLNKKLRGNPID